MKSIILLCLILAGQAQAQYAELAFQVNGFSIHPGGCGASACNENNKGLGFETLEKGQWPFRFTAGFFENSIGYNSTYVGVAKTYRWGEDKYGFELGGLAAWLYYPTKSTRPQVTGETNRNNLLALMPVAVLDLNIVRINAMYIPRIKDETSTVLFFQLVVPLNR